DDLFRAEPVERAHDRLDRRTALAVRPRDVPALDDRRERLEYAVEILVLHRGEYRDGPPRRQRVDGSPQHACRGRIVRDIEDPLGAAPLAPLGPSAQARLLEPGV